ncbi:MULTISPECIES: restriction endonuclease subunit S [Bacillus cereus group]|uniref:Type I restriction modification DNA specificity domain-containing protein n=1 Tax=Bacillus anthracis TaxID=1392 RepID=A0A0J1HUY0_BACAN|nr:MULTISPECIES: restriction endonuclease subunit S [Bacillus cereus group]KLV17493.1 hypothetical protein ABW01_16545 [Bacillus anthracis]MDC2943313.1 restriction endonuclease subunit S [Bacillus thuringiensis]
MKNNHTPEIRFAGFSGDWEQRALKKVLKVNSGRDYKHLQIGDVPVYGTGGYMLSVNDKISDEDAIGIGRKGTIDKPQLLNAPFWTVDTLFFMTPLKGNSLKFIYSMSKLINWKKYDESTGVPSLSKTSIEAIQQYFPKCDEQQQIGEFFEKVDNIINLLQQELTTLKQTKQGFLQKMFPKEGESVPEIRFPGFTGDWKQRRLGELVQINGRIGFRGYTQEDIITKEDGGILTFSPTNIVDNQLTLDVKNTYITEVKYEESPEIKIDNGNILFVKTGSTLGKSALVEGLNEKSTINPQIVILRTEPITQKFLSTVLTTDVIKKQISAVRIGGAVPTLTETELKKFELYVPTNTDEQAKIGVFFTNLDHLITLHQRELDTLKETKKAFLQKMFV